MTVKEGMFVGDKPVGERRGEGEVEEWWIL
jgi:hypothetical protein